MTTEHVRAQGHENVSATHASTFEVTSDEFLTPAGDCIVGIEADRTPSAFDETLTDACQDANATIVITLEVGDYSERIEASGDPRLTFESDRSLVVRTSDYVDDRTVAVKADKAAGDLDRDLVNVLSFGTPLDVTLAVDGTP